jgi:hypothetical protein
VSSRPRTTLRDCIVRAVRERNATLAGRVADVLRFRYGLDYRQTYEAVNAIEPVDPREWEALLYESDTGDAP